MQNKQIPVLGTIAAEIRKLEIAMEEAAPDGTKKVEDEKVAYAKLEDKAFLETAATVVKQSQWQFTVERSFQKRIFRVRHTVGIKPEQEDSYVLTIKGLIRPDGSRDEIELPITKDIYDSVMMVSDRGMNKTRYTFPVEGRPGKLEVDVFDDNPFVKIDYEFSEGEAREFPALPAVFTHVVYHDSTEPRDREFVAEFYKSVDLRLK